MTQAVLPPQLPGQNRAGRSRAALLRAPLLIGTAGTAAAAALNLRDPHVSGAWGACPFLLLTGAPCPGCGSLRAVNDLTHGNVLGALGSNAVAVLLVAVLGLAWIVWVARRWRGHDAPWVRLSWRVPAMAGAVLVVFGVLRLTPWGAGLQP